MFALRVRPSLPFLPKVNTLKPSNRVTETADYKTGLITNKQLYPQEHGESKKEKTVTEQKAN